MIDAAHQVLLELDVTLEHIECRLVVERKDHIPLRPESACQEVSEASMESIDYMHIIHKVG
jgi:hypothetical protein